MAKTIWSYPVKYPYGYSVGYGQTFHTGEDRTITDRRTDIVVTVNGVGIGIAGTTGLSTGLHTHIGKWSGGRHYNPRGGGKTFKSAVVTQVGSDPRNGNFVRVRGDGFDWVYLHLSKITCKVGQKLVAPKPVKKPNETIAREVIAGKWGNGIARITRLTRAGYNPVTIQNIVNQLLKPKAPAKPSTYKVVKGDTLSGIGKKTGVAWTTIAKLNGLKSPYTIYPGQVLKLK